MGFLSMLLLVAVVASACGGVAAAPAALVERGESAPPTQGSQSDAGMDKDGATRDDKSDDMLKEDVSGVATMDDKSDDMLKEDVSSGATRDGESDNMMKEEVSDGATAGDEAAPAPDARAATDYPDWFSAELVNASTGETFRVTDLKGKVVLVETMAIWCSNCLRQQKEVKLLHEAWGERDDLVTLVLDIDPNEDAADLSAYAARNGFTWTYAVAPRDVAREIGQLYGDQFLNPPSTPMLIIDHDGEVHPLPFGRKSAESLQQSLSAFLPDM
jgi:hypothetical protein